MDDRHRASQRGQQRRILIAAGASAAAGAGLFLAQQHNATRSWPHGTPLRVDIGNLAPGRLLAVEWQGLPVWILYRGPRELAALDADDGQLTDPESRASLQPPYARNRQRSLRPDYFVAIGLCTHQGCSPALDGQQFLCPCHASRYDLAGRVFRSGPAPANLTIPAHRFAADRQLIIGEDA